MNKFLLLICFIFSVSITTGYGQIQDALGNAGSYAVLASTQINNNGASGITGNVGVSPGNTINGEDGLVVKNGKIEKNTLSAVNAHNDALVAYNALYARTPSQALDNNLGESVLPLQPGTYKITGDASFKGVLTLTGNSDVNAAFVFIVDGNLLTDAPAAGVLAMNGAQPRNIFWIVTGDVNLGGSTGFQGTILANGNITLGSGVVVIGRAQSINGEVNLNYNNIFLPNVVVTDLQVSKAAEAGTYVIGDEVTYTITATNNGPGTATNVFVNENIPDGLEFVRVESISQGSYDDDAHIWSVGRLENTESATLKLVFKITKAGQLKNGVTVGSRDPDPNPVDNTEEETINVPVPVANLSVVKSASAGPYKVGDLITYTIVATNNGPYTAKGVVVTEVLPAGLQYQSHTTTKGTYNPETGKYEAGDLTNGESVTLTVVAKIVSAGPIVNVANITTPDLPDPDPVDNTDEELIEVTCDDPGLAITGDGNACQGQEVTYTITEVVGGMVSYTLPTGFTEVSRTATTITLKAGSAGGELMVKVKDQCGNEYTSTKDINVTPQLAAPTITGAAAACANATGLTYTINNVVDGVTYEWIVTGDVTLTSDQGLTTATISVGTNGGTISVKAKNTCFESTSAATTISITPVPDKPVFVTSTAEVCVGGNATYEVSEVSDATGYTWNLPEGWIIVTGEGTAKITVKAGEVAGNITVTADNSCGNSEIATLPVTVKNVPAAPSAITGTTSGCIGTNLTFSITPVDGATDYTWTLPQGWTFVSGEHTPTIEVKVGENTGNVTVSVTNNCGTGASATIAVTPLAKPETPTITGPAQSCATSEGNVYTIAAIDGATGYTWNVPQGWTIVSGEGTTSITVTAGTTGGNITVTADNGCGSSAVATFAVTTTDVPAAPVTIVGNASACTGSSITYSVTPVAGATAYNWTLPQGWTIISGENTPTIQVQVGDQAGNVTVSVTNTCGTGAAATIAVTPILTPAQLTITGKDNVCEGEETTYTIPQIDGVNYTYELPAGFTEVSKTATNITVKAGSISGTFEIKAKDLCGNEYTVSKAIVVTPKLATPTISGATSACANATGMTYSVNNPVDGVTYEWIVTGDVTLTSDQGLATATISVGENGGTISVKAKNSCFENTSAIITISITPTPAKPVFVTSATELCAGKDGVYEISEVPGATGYTWNLPEGWTITEGEGTTKITVKAGTASGNITVTADNTCGSSEAATITVTGMDVPAMATITGSNNGCIGTSQTYSIAAVSGATNYTWTVPQGWTIISGENTPTIEVTVGDQAGNVTVAVTNGCGTGAAATIAVAPVVLPTDLAITGPAGTCAGSGDNIYSVTALEGATYTWNLPQGWTILTGENTNSITVTAGTGTGEVSVTVTTPCRETKTVTINTEITTAPASAGFITDNSTFCDGLAYSIDAIAGATNYTWTVPAGCTIISGQGTTSIKVKADNAQVSGDITVTASTGSCTSPEAILALDMTKVDGNLNFPKAFSPNGDGKNDAWEISNLEKYTGSEVTIFNRWGTEVYKQKNYQNDWTGNGLEQGTYFYKAHVKACDGKDQVFTGYVTIFR